MVGQMKRKYILFTTRENDIDMVWHIKDMMLEGIMWPNMDRPRFELLLTEDELLILKLKVPFTQAND